MLSPIEAIAYMFQAHMSRDAYHMAHMAVHGTHCRCYPQLVVMSLGGRRKK